MVFSGDPGESAEVKSFDADDTEYVDGTIERNDHVFDDFYFGAGSVGEQTISVDATFRYLGALPMTVAMADDVKVEVLQPDGRMTRLRLGVPGVGVGFGGVQYLQFDKDFDSSNANTPVGVEYEAIVFSQARNSTKQIAPGNYVVRQTIETLTTRTKTDADGNVIEEKFPLNPDKTSPGRLLDKMNYRLNLAGGGNSTSSPIGSSSSFNDSPGISLEASWAGSYARTDSLSSTLMYAPTPRFGRKAIYVPVAVVNWGWTATANWDPNQNKYVTAVAPPPTADQTSQYTTVTPTWNKTYTSFTLFGGRPKWVRTRG